MRHSRIAGCVVLGIVLVSLFALFYAYASATPPDLLKQLSGHSFWVNDVTWSPDGKILATACANGSIYLWKTP